MKLQCLCAYCVYIPDCIGRYYILLPHTIVHIIK
jgi:hypothetical protein